MTKDEFALPRKINAANPETFGHTAEEFSGDTYNFLRKIRERALKLTTELDALEAAVGGIVTFPGFGAPIGIGGGNTDGVSPLVAHADHDHALRETSGPTDLKLGAITDRHMWRRFGGFVIGRLIHVSRLAGSVSTTSNALSDVAPSQSVALEVGEYSFAYVVFYETAAVTTGLMLGMNFTGGTAVRYRYGVLLATGATAMYSAESGTLDIALGNAGVGPGNTARMGLLCGRIEVTAPGTLALRYASGVAGSAATLNNQCNMLLIQH